MGELMRPTFHDLMEHLCSVSVTILARLCTCFVSLLWAIIVIGQKDALATITPPLRRILAVQNEDWWALGVGVLALTMTYRTVMRVPRGWTDFIGHMLLATFWLYATFTFWLSDPFYPFSIAVSPLVAALSLRGFMGKDTTRP